MSRTGNSKDWQPASWQTKVATQQITYDDAQRTEEVLAQLSALPPIVVSWEIEALKRHLAEAQMGQRFVLQGGDCAESFEDCSSDLIAKKLKILLQMSVVLVYGLKKPVVRVGRMAGQYAKPRSADTETRDGLSLPSYRGDLVNRSPFTPEARRPDPDLMLRAYERAALTLNFVRALIDGGFADLHHPEYWNLDFMRHSPLAAEYEGIVKSISDSIDFLESISGRSIEEINRVSVFACHEGLHLPYEQAQTRYIQRSNRWYNLSTHFPWIGMRTAAIDGAHVEYFRGIANPIGIKISSAMTAEWLEQLIDTLDPRAEPGRLTLIHRFGRKDVEQHLPRIIRSVQATGKTVLWICDPMHGNTETTTSGYKTRRFENVLGELELAYQIHEQLGSRLGGVHIELTGEDVTECTGGARGLTEADLARAYRSQVDPRLNYEQAMELAMHVAGLRKDAGSREPLPTPRALG
jgi:3-deoxy-7-phosphoheptulonate synthase